MSKPSVEGARGIAKKLKFFWALLIEELRDRKNWTVRLLTIDVVLLLFLSPLLLTTLGKVGTLGSLPEWYTQAFWATTGVIFAAALITIWYKSVTFWLFAVGLAGATVIVIMVVRLGVENPSVNNRFVSTLFTFFVGVFLGGGIPVLRKWQEREREAAEKRKQEARESRSRERELLLATHNQLLSAYNKAKRIRRILRARVLPPADVDASSDAHVILASEYDEQMETLIDAQLEFETIERMTEGNVDLFGSVSDFDDRLDAIRGYLYATVREYENQRTRFHGDPPSMPLSMLPELSSFMGSRGRDQGFRDEFRTPFKDALMSLRLAAQDRLGKVRSKRPIAQPTRRSTLGLGMLGTTVRLKRHNPAWADRFREESDRLSTTIGDLAPTLEHVGSTAVPELWALPVIDILAGVSSLKECKVQLTSDLGRCGYLQSTHPAGAEQLFFRRSRRDVWTHSLSVAEQDSDYFRSSVELRDHLRTNPEARQRYDAEKRRLAKEHMGYDAYRHAKAELIAEFCESLAPGA